MHAITWVNLLYIYKRLYIYIFIFCLECRRPQFDSWVRKIWWRRDRLPTPVFLGFPCGSAGKRICVWDFPGGSDSKVPVYNVGNPGSIPGLGRSPGGGNGNPLQCSCLENSMDRGAWRATVHRVTRSQTRLSN